MTKRHGRFAHDSFECWRRRCWRFWASFRNIDQIKAIGVVDKIINNAVKIGEVPVSANEIDTTKAVHIFYCPINIDGKQYSARMVVKEYYQGNHVVDELHLYNNQLREERTGQTPAQPQGSPKVLSPILSGYKVKDLIHSTQEADKKLLGITTETGGGKLFREGRWRAGDVLRVEGGSWQEERRMRSYVTGEWLTETETHGRYRLPGFSGEYHSLEALCDALRMGGKMEDNNEYGLTNAREMMAELSNPVFRGVLKAKKLWRQLINGVKRLLGMEVVEGAEETDALTVLDAALETLLANYDGELYRRYRGGDSARELNAEVGRPQGGRTPDREEAEEYHRVIDEMFENEDFDKAAHARDYYDLGYTPDWMQGIGIRGNKFSLSFKNIKTHQGKDADHNLSPEA